MGKLSSLAKAGKKLTVAELRDMMKPNFKSMAQTGETLMINQTGQPSAGGIAEFAKRYNPTPDIADMRQRNGFGIISAEQNKAQLARRGNRDIESISDAELNAYNKRATLELMRELKASGRQFNPSYGIYGNMPETSFVMHGGDPSLNAMPDTWVNQLGRRYNQESVVAPHGLQHTDGTLSEYPPDGSAGYYPMMDEITRHETPPENYYTDVQGQKFTLNMDFDKLLSSYLKHKK